MNHECICSLLYITGYTHRPLFFPLSVSLSLRNTMITPFSFNAHKSRFSKWSQFFGNTVVFIKNDQEEWDQMKTIKWPLLIGFTNLFISSSPILFWMAFVISNGKSFDEVIEAQYQIGYGFTDLISFFSWNSITYIVAMGTGFSLSNQTEKLTKFNGLARKLGYQFTEKGLVACEDMKKIYKTMIRRFRIKIALAILTSIFYAGVFINFFIEDFKYLKLDVNKTILICLLILWIPFQTLILFPFSLNTMELSTSATIKFTSSAWYAWKQSLEASIDNASERWATPIKRCSKESK